MKFLRAIKPATYKLASVSEYIGWSMLLGVSALMTAGTIARYVFRSPFIFQVELVSIMLIVFASLCFAPVFLQGGHIRVNLITRRLPQRTQDWLWLSTELVVMALAILIIINMIGLVSTALEINSRFEISNIIEAPFIICIQVGFGLFAWVVLVDFCERLYKVLKGQKG